MNCFHVTVLASERPFFEGECESLVIPTTQGKYGIQANHSDMIAAIVPGILKITLPGGKVRFAALSEGLVKVKKNRVLLLVETAENPEEIDEERARYGAEEAREEILRKKSLQDYQSAQARLARAMNRLKAKQYEKDDYQ